MTAADFRALANPTVIVTAIVYGFLLRLAGAAGFFGFLLWLMVMLSLWRYGYAVLRHVASGWNNFPPPEIESMNPFGEFAVIFHSTLVLVAALPAGNDAVRRRSCCGGCCSGSFWPCSRHRRPSWR